MARLGAGSPPRSFTLAEDAEDAGKGCKAVYKAAEAATAAGQSCAQCGKTAVEAARRACPSALYCSIACASARWPAQGGVPAEEGGARGGAALGASQ